MDDNDDNFFTRLDRGNNTFQNRLRNAPRDDDDVPMPAAPLFGEEEEETPLQKLIRHWMNERHAPDILPVAETVLAGLLDHIRRQVGEIHCAILVNDRFMTWCFTVRDRPVVAVRSLVLRGRALSDYARSDRGRAGQVCCPIIPSDEAAQGERGVGAMSHRPTITAD